jgi:hypothetical protein
MIILNDSTSGASLNALLKRNFDRITQDIFNESLAKWCAIYKDL